MTSAALDEQTSKVPFYRRVADALKAEIIDGSYPVGSLLPTEQDLGERFSASRYTVREALRLLMEDGMVERRQGRGTEVVRSQETPVYAQSLTSLSQLYDYAADTRFLIDRVLTIVADEELAQQLGRLPGRQWLMAEGVRTTSAGDVICATRVYLHQDFAELGPELAEHQGAIHPLIEDRFGVQVSEVHQEITTGRPGSAIAAQINDPSAEMAILVTRRYLGADDRPILVSMNWHRLAGFAYGQVLRRE